MESFLYTLTGIRGWSLLNISTIDISKVTKVKYHKRLFCIFDREYPYTLSIEYKEQKSSTVFGSNYLEPTQKITKRYKTENDLKCDLMVILQNDFVKTEAIY